MGIFESPSARGPARLRELLAGPGPVLAPGAYDALSARLVEAAGLKGHRLGTAHVSEKHANFIQADEGGSADDVWALVAEVQRRVEGATGIHLVPELRVVGFSQP